MLQTYLDLISDPVFKYFFHLSNIVAVICLIVSIKTDNYSQIDRLWSILPPFYTWLFLLTSVFVNTNTSLLRMGLMSLLVTIWGARLTYNFWRKGGYSGENEDYRWFYVKKALNYPENKLLFQLLNIFFISFFQSYLLLAIVLPMWYIQVNQAQTDRFNFVDLIAVILFILFLSIEILADQQQWSYQTNKYKWLAEKDRKENALKYDKEQIEDFKRGFLCKGLFKYSRHPNFFSEMSIWWVFYIFTLSSQYSSLSVNGLSFQSLINYSIAGTLSLTILFQFSTILTEQITSNKYKEYLAYKTKVSRFVLLPSNYEPSKKN